LTTTLARREKVTSQTIRRWIKSGKYERVDYTEGGHARVWIDTDATVVLYARVSSAKQKTSLETQEKMLRETCPEGEFLSDVASGFNSKRRAFRSILERALSGEPIRLVATTSDRIARSGFPLIRHIIELSGGSIELLEEEDCPEQFDVRTLVAFITSYCNSVHGKRSHQRHKKDQGIPEE